MRRFFTKLANKISASSGSPFAALLAVCIVLVWAISGPFFKFSPTWQLFINTLTTVVTFLMVFLIQNAQNRESKALQLKLDELIRASRPARDEFVGLEGLSDEELAILDEEFQTLRASNASSPTMKKLHQRIAEAKQQRKTVRHIAHGAAKAAGKTVETIVKHLDY
jgi:low affinity Fe/Cu permease